MKHRVDGLLPADETPLQQEVAGTVRFQAVMFDPEIHPRIALDETVSAVPAEGLVSRQATVGIDRHEIDPMVIMPNVGNNIARIPAGR